MDMKNKNATYIKAKLIDFILEKKSKSVIGSEIMYGHKKRVVDILELSKGKTIAYEIKAFKDDFRKLGTQILEYQKVFDYIYIVITSNHLSKISLHLKDNSIGVLLLDDNDNISCIKRATCQKSNSKDDILSTINAIFLKKYFSIKSSIDASTTRTILSKKSLAVMKETLYIYLHQTISPRFNLFLREKGDETLIVDIEVLSFYRKKLLR